jgi:hypothetical protein
MNDQMNEKCAREPQVVEWILRAQTLLGEASESSEMLENRLVPVMGLDDPAGANAVKTDTPEPSLAPVAEELRHICRRLQRLIDRTHAVIRRLEI